MIALSAVASSGVLLVLAVEHDAPRVHQQIVGIAIGGGVERRLGRRCIVRFERQRARDREVGRAASRVDVGAVPSRS